ncbi:hypothetical protein V6N13_033100 [Hibiscus sabdariffa]
MGSNKCALVLVATAAMILLATAPTVTALMQLCCNGTCFQIPRGCTFDPTVMAARNEEVMSYSIIPNSVIKSSLCCTGGCISFSRECVFDS